MRGILSNNNYNASMVEDQIRRQLDKHHIVTPNSPSSATQMTTSTAPHRSTSGARSDNQERDKSTPQQASSTQQPASSTQQQTPALVPAHLKPAQPTESKKLRLYYQSTMTSAYKKEEKAIRSIVSRNCIPANEDDDLQLVIYYRSPTVSNLVLRNNMSHVPSLLKSTNVVYKFKCNTGDCAHLPNRTYIGHTVTTMSRRITMHLQDGAPLKHMRQDHKADLTRTMMVDNTTIIARCPKRKKLQALEAVFIRDSDPWLNRQLNLRGSLTLFDAAPLLARV